VLLILKERLSREHPALIFAKVENQGKSDAHTVDFNLAVERLKVNAGVAINKHDERLLRDAQALRNNLEHYHVELPLTEAQNVIGRMAEFLYEFMQEELKVDLGELRRISAAIEREREEDWMRRAASYGELAENELRDLFDDTPYHPKHNPVPQEHLYCESCDEETAVIPSEDGDIGVCTNPQCREIYHVDHCMRCDTAILGSRAGSGVFCDSCYSDMQKD
jgi:hypothetical protein